MSRAVRRMVWTLLAMLALGVAVTWNLWMERLRGREPIEPGVFYAMGATRVTGVLVSASDYKFHAYRWDAGQPFQIMVIRPSRDSIEACKAGEAFAEWLEMVVTLVNGRQLQGPTRGDPADWTRLELITNDEFEGQETRLLLPTTPHEPIVAEFHGLPGQYPVEWNSSAFATIKAGCSTMGERG